MQFDKFHATTIIMQRHRDSDEAEYRQPQEILEDFLVTANSSTWSEHSALPLTLDAPPPLSLESAVDDLDSALQRGESGYALLRSDGAVGDASPVLPIVYVQMASDRKAG